VQVIKRASASFDIGVDETMCRSQFPVSMSFGVTAHKCQGLTAQNIIVSTNKMFADGQAFVAFSRVTSLAGLHLVDFNPTKITCDVKALMEYNRLRQTINLTSIELPVVQRKVRNATRENRAQAPPAILAVSFNLSNKEYFNLCFIIACFYRLLLNELDLLLPVFLQL